MRGFRVALSFLTRLPVRAGDVSGAELARAVAFFPLVGLVLGALAWFVAWSLGRLHAPELTALAIVALHALATGALHLDGVADVFDGLGGGRGERERILAIMRDSRIGAHGAVALTLLLLAKVAATRLTLERDATWALCAAPIAARFAVVPLIVGFRYAREQGLGSVFREHAGKRELIGAAVLALLCLVPFGLAVIGPAVLALVLALGFGLALQRKLGGLTGDVYGAAIELAELAFLLASAFGLRVAVWL